MSKWLEAAKLLRENIYATVICPECGVGHLFIRDEMIPHWEEKIDRYMICDYCGKYNVLTMEKPQGYRPPSDISNN